MSLNPVPQPENKALSLQPDDMVLVAWKFARSWCGLGLVTTGIGVVVFTLVESYLAYAMPEHRGFLVALKGLFDGQSFAINTFNGIYSVGAGGAWALALGFFVLFAMLGIFAGLQMVRAGAHVLAPKSDEHTKELGRLILELKELKSQLTVEYVHTTPNLPGQAVIREHEPR